MSDIDFFAFGGREIPGLLIRALRQLDKKNKIRALEIGCGEGAVLFSLIKTGLLDNKKVTAVDISSNLLKVAKRRTSKGIKFICADATNTGLKKSSFDLIYSVMVIEHLEKPQLMLKEVNRLLKMNGVAFISTIIKKPWAVYFYRKNGKFVIDPTHLYEFSSYEELKGMLKRHDLEVSDYYVYQRYYSLLELIVKVLLRMGLFSKSDRVRDMFGNNMFINTIRRKFIIPIPGYYEVGVLCKKE